MTLKKAIRFSKKNYFILIFLAAVLFVGLVIASRLIVSEPEYVYAKVKVGQGYWWASTQRASIWLVNSINEGDVAFDLVGNKEAEVLKKTYYRYFGGDQYDVYLTLKLKVRKSGRTGTYSFNRTTLAIGAPIEIQFTTTQVTGTIIALSDKPFEGSLVEKRIELTKKYANPWEFDAVMIGDKASNGEDVIFEVIDKQNKLDTGLLSVYAGFSNIGQAVIEPTDYITVSAKVKLKEENGEWILGEDQIISVGRNINISTGNFTFDNYTVTKIE